MPKQSSSNHRNGAYDFCWSQKALSQEEVRTVSYPDIVAGWDELENLMIELNAVSDLYKNECDFLYIVNDYSYEGFVTSLKVKDYVVMRRDKGAIVYLKTEEPMKAGGY